MKAEVIVNIPAQPRNKNQSDILRDNLARNFPKQFSKLLKARKEPEIGGGKGSRDEQTEQALPPLL